MKNDIIEFKAGMRVKLRNGMIGVLIPVRDTAYVHNGFSIVYFNDQYDLLNNITYTKNLKRMFNDKTDKDDNEIYRKYDIMAVYDVPIQGGSLTVYNRLEKEDLLWQRIEPKEMTLEEIEKKLGYPIKVVTSHEHH